MVLELCYYGNPVLRQKCAPVDKLTPEVLSFIDELVETMNFHNGIGIAASQVGKLLRIFVIRQEIIHPDGKFEFGEPEVFINPKLSNPSEEIEVMNEGCLSLPKLYIDVERPISIDLEFMDIQGKIHNKRVEGFTARQIMHENDHLNGTLTIDRCSKGERKRAEPFLRQIKKKFKKF